jgi:hypothetical protein
LLADWAWAEREGKSQISNPKFQIAGRAREAEGLLRECLAVRLRDTNTTPWRVSDMKSRLGGALVSVAVTDRDLNAAARETKLAEAETLLVEGSQRLLESQTADKKIKRHALERLMRLYEAWGKLEKRAEWQEKLEAFDQAQAQSPAPEERASQ